MQLSQSLAERGATGVRAKSASVRTLERVPSAESKPQLVASANAYQRAIAAGGLELLDTGWLQTLVVYDREHYQVGIQYLAETIQVSLQQKDPMQWLTGLVVVPQGLSFQFSSINEKKLELANQRILVRSSDLPDTLAGAKQLQQQILRQHEKSNAHALRFREAARASFR